MLHIHRKRGASGHPVHIPHNVSLKKRMWPKPLGRQRCPVWLVHTLFYFFIAPSLDHAELNCNQARDNFSILEPYLRDESSQAWIGIKKCKDLAWCIKVARAPV